MGISWISSAALGIGAIAGRLQGFWFMGRIGLLWNILTGIAGALWQLCCSQTWARFDLGGIVGAIVTSTLGAVVLLLIVNLIQRLVS
jgi:uncharacterized membrane protein YeaQ/YmgE (transglycosylase-associated protein family)